MTKEEFIEELEDSGYVLDTNPQYKKEPFIYSDMGHAIFFHFVNIRGRFSPWLFKYVDGYIRILSSDQSEWIAVESMPIPTLIALYK